MLNPFDKGTLRDDTALSKPRYFAFGEPRFDIKDQIAIAKALVGNVKGLDERVKSRREAGWRAWFDGQKDDGGFGRFDVPAIIMDYVDYWDIEVAVPPAPMQINRRHFNVDDFEAIERELRVMLVSFGVASSIHRRDLPSPLATLDNDTDAGVTDAAEDNADGNGRSGSPEDARTPTRRPGSRVGSGDPSLTPYPEPLLLASLRCCTEAGRIDWEKAEELSGLEYLLHLVNDKDFVASAVPAEMEREGVAMPMTISVEEISAMSPRLRATAKQLVDRARGELLGSMGPCYQPRDDEFLYQWLRDGR